LTSHFTGTAESWDRNS